MSTPGLQVVVHDDDGALGTAVAGIVREALERTRRAGRPCLVGVPAGRTLRPVLAALTADLHQRPLPLDHLVVVMMDDYLKRSAVSGTLERVDPDADHSCWRFGRVEVVDALGSAVAGSAAGTLALTPSLWSPDPADPAAYDGQIAAAGGIELFLVAVGAGDGHVALNPPGTPLESRTRVLEIAETTRRDNLATFPSLAAAARRVGLAAVPTHGVTVGLGTIAAARQVVGVVHGADKAGVVARVLAAGGFDPALPATFLHAVPSAVVHLDAAAAGAAGRVSP